MLVAMIATTTDKNLEDIQKIYEEKLNKIFQITGFVKKKTGCYIYRHSKNVIVNNIVFEFLDKDFIFNKRYLEKCVNIIGNILNDTNVKNEIQMLIQDEKFYKLELTYFNCFNWEIKKNVNEYKNNPYIKHFESKIKS